MFLEQPLAWPRSTNKPAALAAGQTLPDATQIAKSQYLLDQYSDLDALQDLESLIKCQYSLFYDWKHDF